VRRIVLDTSAIISQPSTVSYSSPDTQLIVPDVVVAELSGFQVSSYSNLLTQLASTPAAPIVVSSESDAVTLPSFNRVLSGVDSRIIGVASRLRQEYPQDEVLIATEDRDLQGAARSLGVKTLSGEELHRLLEPRGQRDQQLAARAREVSRYQVKHLVGSAIGGAVTTTLATLLIRNLDRVLATVNIWGSVIGIPSLGLALYWWRSHYRLAYGLTEFGVGLVASVSVLWPSFQVSQLAASGILQFVGGLYVVVRGLDNIGQGLRGTRLQVFWDRWFRNGGRS